MSGPLRCPAPLDADDLRRLAHVLFDSGHAGNEPSFSTRQSGFGDQISDCWDVIDAEFDLTVRCVDEGEANATAAAMNRLAEHWR